MVTTSPFRFERVDPTDQRAINALQTYFAELATIFPGGFDPGDTLVTDAHHFRPPTGAFLIARRGEVTVACGAVQRIDADIGEIKRMWVDGSVRGRGLGRQMLAKLELTVAELGYDTVVLDTNDHLGPAIALYESAGYESIAAYNDNPFAKRWFGKSLT